MYSNQTRIFNYPKEHRFYHILAALAFTILVAGAFCFLIYIDLFVARTPFSQQDVIFLALATSTFVVFGLIPLISAFPNKSIIISNQGISGPTPGIRPKRVFIPWNEVVSVEELPGTMQPASRFLFNSYIVKGEARKEIGFLETIENAKALLEEIVSHGKLIQAEGYQGFQYSKPGVAFIPRYINKERVWNKTMILVIAGAITAFFFVIGLVVKSAGGISNFFKIILGKP